jgi:tetratricopeptide (TPR) repeat protein
MLMESARFPSAEQLDAVSASLASADPLVRMGGVSALAGLDVNERMRRLQPLLADPAKSVRMMVARELIDVPSGQAPPELRFALGKLLDEYEQSLQHNADMPEAMNDLGLFHAAQGDLDAAEKAILHARELSPGYLPAMLNLADLYRARNRDDLGEPVLREALVRYPKSGEAQHALGLLYVRTGRTAESVALFKAASALEPGNAQFALVYAMALVETGSRSKGIAALEAAAKRFPNDEVITKTLSEYRGYRN